MGKLGQFLKESREKKGLSLHEIGMSLKINPKILKSIEDNDVKTLPAKTFLRGFVRSYAQYLKIDVDYALQLFQEEYGSTRPKEEIFESQSITEDLSQATVTENKVSKEEKRSEPLNLSDEKSGRWYQAIAGIVILIVIAMVAKTIDKYQKESQVESENIEIANPIDPTTTTIIESNLIITNSASQPERTALMTPIASSTSTTLTTISSTTIPPTTSTVPKSTSTTSTTTTLSTTTTTVAKTTTTTILQGNVSFELIVEALNNVQIKYVLGNDSSKTLNLKRDELHTFKANSKLKLEISDGGAVNLIFNGRDRGVPGTIGKSINLNFP